VVDAYKTVGCTITGRLVLGDLRWMLEQTADYPADSQVEIHSGELLADGGPDIVIVRPYPRGGDDDDLPDGSQAR
jgi:hypothetical protein